MCKRIGSKDNLDVDAMWEALAKDRVVSGIGLGFGEVELPVGPVERVYDLNN